METTEICKNNISPARQGEEESWDNDGEFQELVQSLPKERDWYGGSHYFYQGFWCPSSVFKAVLSFQKHFQALDTDIILASAPKCGTTWLKSLIFTIVNRKHFALEDNPLMSSNPHKLVPFFEYDVYYLGNPSPYLENNPYNPRIFSIHIPYASLPTSIVKDSNCKIVYVSRNPMDMFISYWHFTDKLRPENVNPISLDEAFEMFCQGIHTFGPFYDHVLDLKEDIVSQAKELAEFLGFPFSKEEEKQGVVEEIAKLCSFENLKELEVNKSGNHTFGTPNKAYFRKGVVGDWSNYLTPLMVERFEKLIQGKLGKFGLTFKLSSQTKKDACA
ncbi:hypothetical protein CRYUN_Cryun05aG0044500 [Craigia yunnanensis]